LQVIFASILPPPMLKLSYLQRSSAWPKNLASGFSASSLVRQLAKVRSLPMILPIIACASGGMPSISSLTNFIVDSQRPGLNLSPASETFFATPETLSLVAVTVFSPPQPASASAVERANRGRIGRRMAGFLSWSIAQG